MTEADWYESWEPTGTVFNSMCGSRRSSRFSVRSDCCLSVTTARTATASALRVTGSSFVCSTSAGMLGFGVLEGPLPPLVALFVTGRSGYADRNAIEVIRRYLEQRTPWRIKLQNKYFHAISVRDRIG